MRRLKIVHCANFSETKFGKVFYSIDRKLSNGLIRNGYFVYDFSYREIARNLSLFGKKKWGASKMNLRLKETIKQVNPDVLLLGHSELISLETIIQIKQENPNIKIAMWWVDPFDKSGHINERLPYLDAFFSTTSPEYYSTLFTNKTSFYYMSNPCDSSIETGKAYEVNEYLHDLIFIGRSDGKRQEMVTYLKGIDFLNVGIYGDRKDTLVFGEMFLSIVSHSKMAINYSRYNDIPLYSSDRVIQLLAQGVLVFSPRIPEFDTLFDKNEIIYFDTFSDLNEKIKYYYHHDDERREVAKKGWQKAHDSFEVTKITKKMIENIYGGTR